MFLGKKISGFVAGAIVITLFALQASLANAAFVDYQRTVVVSPVGPTASDNGTALLTALSNIVSGFPAPSETDRYLLKIEPGVYNVATTSVVLPAYVDMEGSGEGVTLITGVVENAFSLSAGVVSLGTNAEVRAMTVANTADGVEFDSAAIVLFGGARAQHVTAIATGSATINRALLAGFGGDGIQVPFASNVTAKAETRAVQVLFPGLDAQNLVATGTQGLLVSSGNMFVRNSRFSGSDFSMLVANLSENIDLVTTQLSGEISCLTKVCRCFASYDDELKPLKRKCKAKK